MDEHTTLGDDEILTSAPGETRWHASDSDADDEDADSDDADSDADSDDA